MRSQILASMEPDFSFADDYLRQQEQQKAQIQKEMQKKTELSFDEKKLGTAVAEMFAGQLPEGKKIEASKHPNALAAVGAAFDKKDPRREAMVQTKKNYAELLRNPEFAGAGPNQLLHVAKEATIHGTPSKKVPGQTLADDIHRHYYKTEVAGLAPFGWGRGNTKPMEGFDEWVEAERAKPVEKRSVPAWEAALWGGGGYTALKGAGKVLAKSGAKGLSWAGKALTKTPWLPAKAAGYALTAIPWFMASDFLNNQARKTDWYRAREDQPIYRDAALAAAEIGFALPANVAGSKVAARTAARAVEKGIIGDAAVKMFAEKQTADRIMAVAKARKSEKVALDKLQDSLLYKATPEQKKSLYEHLNAVGRNFTHRYDVDSLLKGDIAAASRHMDEMFATAARPKALPGAGELLPPAVKGAGRSTRIFPRNVPDDGDVPPTGPGVRAIGSDTKELPPGGVQASPPGPKPLPPTGGAPIKPVTANRILELPAGTKTDWMDIKVNPTPAKVQKQFNKLDMEETALVTDRILNSKQPVNVAIADILGGREIGKAVAKSEVKISPTVSETEGYWDDVIKGLREVKLSDVDVPAPKIAAVKRSRAGGDAIPNDRAAREAKLLEDLKADGGRSAAKILQATAGDKAIKKATAAKRTAAATAAKQAKAEKAVHDPTFDKSEFEDVMRGTADRDEYLRKLSDPGPDGDYAFRQLESERIANDLLKAGIKQRDISTHPAMQTWTKEFAAPAARVTPKEVSDAAADIAGMTSPEDLLRGGVVSRQLRQKAAKEEEGVSTLVDKLATILKIGAAGAIGSVLVSDLLGPSEAHASPSAVASAVKAGGMTMPKGWLNKFLDYRALKKMPKAEAEKRMKSFIKEADEAGYTARPVADTDKVIPRRMQSPDFATVARELYVELEDSVASVKPMAFGFGRLMGAWGRGALHYATGANPAVHIAGIQTAWTNNIDAGFKVLANVMRDVPGGTSSARVVSKAMAPLAENYQEIVGARSAVLTRLEQLTKKREKISEVLKDKKLSPENRAKIEERLTRHIDEEKALSKASKELEPQYQKFAQEHDRITRELARDHPSVRVFLASEDTADFTHRPWLRGLMNGEEINATNHLKGMMKTYQDAAVERGLGVISSRPYMHYGWHDKWAANAGEKWLKDKGLQGILPKIPFNDFHHRTKGALPLMPDAWHSIQRYIPQAEKTLNWNDFWKSGWKKHMHSSVVRNNEGLRSYWNSIIDASKPMQQTEVDKWLNRYFNLEVFRLLGFSPSVAFKHYFKNIGTWGSLGLGEAVSHMHTAAATAYRIKFNSAESREFFKKWGIPAKQMNKKFYDDAAASYTKTARMMNILDHMEMLPETQVGWMDNWMQQINRKAGFMTAAVESYDRVHSFLAASEMGLKRGLTAKDASYAIWDTVLKNNFLGGALNPAWARSSKVRALMLFQTTAFKILERRVVNGIQTKRAVSDVFKSVKSMPKGTWTWDKISEEMDSLKRFITSGEYEFKKGIITDALAGHRDFLGQFHARQTMRELLYVGAVIGGGAALGHDYHHHVSHLPFLSGMHKDPTIGLSPAASALHKTKEGMPYDGEFSQFGAVGDFLRHWSGSAGPIPQMITKNMNISKDDIPERYKDEGFLPKEIRYLFAIPSKKEKDTDRRILPDLFWEWGE